MTRRLLLSVSTAAAALLAGCIPVYGPLSDPTKAELDKGLIGTWLPTENALNDNAIEIDAPVVKGNPKGLARARFVNPRTGKDDPHFEPHWFTTTTLGKDTYANLFTRPQWEPPRKRGTEYRYPIDFGGVGNFAAWQKKWSKECVVAHYTLSGDKLALHFGDGEETQKLLPEGKAADLAVYLTKHGPDDLYPPDRHAKYSRKK